MGELELIATCAFGLEAVVKRELAALGYDGKTLQPGRILFRATAAAIPRTNLWLRTAERVLLCVGRFDAADFDQLFDQTRDLPWDAWIPPDGAFPVNGKSVRSQLSSVPAVQRAVKKAVVERLLASHSAAELPESGATFTIEVALLDDVATLTLDTTGDGLHKRGYRPLTGPAPLRETLAAALVSLSFWKPGRSLLDPFCGTGTIPIEAALIGRQIAPGLQRSFVSEQWPAVPTGLWDEARREARDLIRPNLDERIMGTDINPRDLKFARQHADAAGVGADIHFQQRAFEELTSKRTFGCVICNPPYGHRIGNQREVDALYREFPRVLRRLPTWSHFVLTAHPAFEKSIGQTADRRRKLYNGRIECQYYQFHGPNPHERMPSGAGETTVPEADAPETDGPETAVTGTAAAGTNAASPEVVRTSSVAAGTRRVPVQPVFGGVDQASRRLVDEFQARLAKRARHLRRWPSRGITCYRLYERDVPAVPLVVDRYEDRLHIAEFARPHERTPAEHADWLDLLKKAAGEVMDVHPSNIFMKFRDRQRGASQYERRGSDGHEIVVHEGGLKFRVNLSDYLDTGLFLDHRITRSRVRELSDGCRMLNLFGYTGSFSVYAAAGHAASTVTVDSSRTYLEWAEENMRLNGFRGSQHRTIRADAFDYLHQLNRDVRFDLAVVDPPTFSNSKEIGHDWDVQQDHAELLRLLSARMTPGGTIFFSTNFRRFKLAEDELTSFDRPLGIREISRQTVPPDFRNRRIHRCWQLTANP